MSGVLVSVHPNFAEAKARGEMSGYSLKAACSHCDQFGTVDDMALICFRCGELHEITVDEVNQRNADMALWQSAMAFRRATQR